MRSSSANLGAANDDEAARAPFCLTICGSLFGDKLVSKDGETLGMISDVMIDVASGRLIYLLVAAGGFMGVGERLFPIPWGAVHYEDGKKWLVLNANTPSLDKAPGFYKTHLPSPEDRAWHEQVHRYYRITPYWKT